MTLDTRRKVTFALRRALGRSWSAFFARFGSLTDVQLEAIPHILAGKNVLVVSPTASGKTEAVLAPLFARYKQELGGHGVQILYIVPTRALVADLQERIAGILEELGVVFAFRTSDTPTLPKQFPNVLFTTPESFDSLLCRKRGVWNNVKAIVLDELHLVDNTYRGDQLRVLLKRLELELDHAHELQKVGLSATIPDIEGVVKRYLGTAQVVQLGEPRKIEFHIVKSLKEAVELAKKRRRFRLIVFCNSRPECELLASEAKSKRIWPADSICVHHGSLSKAERKEAERLLREGTRVLCFATTTLELGIDVGNVDGIVLYGPPYSVSSFLQRIGRGCRREDTIFAIGIAKNKDDIEAFHQFHQMAEKGQLEKVEYTPDYSVVVQQIFSMLYQNPSGLELDTVAHCVSPLCSQETLLDIIQELVEQELIHFSGNRIYPEESVLTMGDRGDIHSNIPDQRKLRVIDSATNREVGEVSSYAATFEAIVVGGVVWRVLYKEKRNLYVERMKQDGKIAKFPKKSEFGKYFKYLPVKLQRILEGENETK